MKKNTLISTTVLVALGVSTLAQPASAAVASTATNNADVQFRKKTVNDPNENAIIEPENENREDTVYPNSDKEDKRPTNRGPLVIDYISDYHFDEQIMSGNNATYYAKTATVFEDAAKTKPVIVPNFVQITDDRGNNAGWALKVKQTKDFTVDGKDVSASTDDGSALRGTTLTIKNINAFKRKSNGGALPTRFNTDNKVTLSTGAAEELFASAQVGEGTGSIALLAGNVKNTDTAAKSISLDVPGNIKKKSGVQYKAELTWTLEDTPA